MYPTAKNEYKETYWWKNIFYELKSSSITTAEIRGQVTNCDWFFSVKVTCEIERMDPCVSEIPGGEIETIIRVDWICVEALCNSCRAEPEIGFCLKKLLRALGKKKVGPLSTSQFRLLGRLELIQTTTEITCCWRRSETVRNAISLVNFAGEVSFHFRDIFWSILQYIVESEIRGRTLFNQHTNQCTHITFFTLLHLKSLQHVSILRSSSGSYTVPC